MALVLPPSPGNKKFIEHEISIGYKNSTSKCLHHYLTLPDELLVRRQRVNSSPYGTGLSTSFLLV